MMRRRTSSPEHLARDMNKSKWHRRALLAFSFPMLMVQVVQLVSALRGEPNHVSMRFHLFFASQCVFMIAFALYGIRAAQVKWHMFLSCALPMLVVPISVLLIWGKAASPRLLYSVLLPGAVLGAAIGAIWEHLRSGTRGIAAVGLVLLCIVNMWALCGSFVLMVALDLGVLPRPQVLPVPAPQAPPSLPERPEQMSEPSTNEITDGQGESPFFASRMMASPLEIERRIGLLSTAPSRCTSERTGLAANALRKAKWDRAPTTN